MTAIAALTCAALCALAVALVVANAPVDEKAERGLLEAVIVGVPLVAGLALLRSPGDRRFSVMLLGAGAAWSLSALGQSSDSLAYSTGRVAAWLIFPLLVFLMLAFPTGRLRRGVDRYLLGGVTAVVAVLYIGSALFVEAFPLYTPWATCRLDCPANAFLVLDAEPAVMHDVVSPLRELLGALLLVGVTVRLAWRVRAATPARRRVLTPLLLASAASTAALVAFFVVRRSASDAETIELVGIIWSLTVPGVAFAFMLGLMRRRAIAGEMLGRLSIALSGPLDGRQLGATLRSALDDPTMDVLVPDGVPGRWRDTERPRRGAVDRERAASSRRSPIGSARWRRSLHDPALCDDEELLEAVRALVMATVRHGLVTTQLAASLSELEGSRQRIARAADVERSRIERDLHDGAQQRLIGLRIKLALAEETTQTDAARGRRDDARPRCRDRSHARGGARDRARRLSVAARRPRARRSAAQLHGGVPDPGAPDHVRRGPPVAGDRDGGLLHVPGGDAERVQARRARRPGCGSRCTRAATSCSSSATTDPGSRRRSATTTAGCGTCATASRPSGAA